MRKVVPSMIGLLISFVLILSARAEDAAYGPMLEGFDYPYPVAHYRFSSQGASVDMAYMDVKPTQPNGQTVVLLHGKNFCAASWESVIDLLVKKGYRVVAPDQIGFCKSSKPDRYQFSFQQLAQNTRGLMQSLGVTRFTLMGHSTGGMLGIRYALMYPQDLAQLVLVSPVGLEDWKAKGVPWASIDTLYEQEKKTSANRVKAYEANTYYVGTWPAAAEKWAGMYAGLYAGPGRDKVAWNSALIYDMIYTQPVVYEFEHLSMPVLLISGDKDNTAIGKGFAPPAVQATLGNYAVLAPEAAARIPHAKLVTFPDLGHATWIQAPARFNQALLDGLVK